MLHRNESCRESGALFCDEGIKLRVRFAGEQQKNGNKCNGICRNGRIWLWHETRCLNTKRFVKGRMDLESSLDKLRWSLSCKMMVAVRMKDFEGPFALFVDAWSEHRCLLQPPEMLVE